jgi:two-component system LytT family response regulator
MTALIVDDEPLARGYLHRMLEDQGVIVVGEAEGAAQALQLAEDLSPKLVFLDIQMPGLTGLQFAEALQQSTSDAQIVFVTGYSEYAAQAFEQAALDYLMKPVSPVRLAKTLVRARERFAAGSSVRGEEARRITEQTKPEMGRLQRLPIRKDYAVLLVRLEEIRCAIARDKRVLVRMEDGGEHRTYYTLTQLEALLPRSSFCASTTPPSSASMPSRSFCCWETTATRSAHRQRSASRRANRYALLQERLGLSAHGVTPPGRN